VLADLGQMVDVDPAGFQNPILASDQRFTPRGRTR
jgi:hypothetical protein